MQAPLKDYRVGAPMDRVGIDVLGPLPKSNRGNTCLLVVADYFTRFVEAYPMPNQQAETTAHTLVSEFFSRYGVCLELHSDQGRNFESELFQEVCHMLQIKKTRSTPLRPCSNGLVERFNRTLAQMIRSFIGANMLDWDVYIPLLTAAYRSTVHPATGYTPNLLFLGREVHMPIDLIYPRPRAEEPPEVHEYVSRLRDEMEECYHSARENLRRMAEKQKRDYDTRLCEQKYERGDLVYKRHHIQKKLEVPWVGPYVIVRAMGDSIYKITDKKKATVVHHDRLKPYLSSFIPAWAVAVRRRLTNGATA